MPIKDPKELFVTLLSDLRNGAERSTKVFEELSQIAQDPDVKEAMNARVHISAQILDKIDECFKLIGQKPQKVTGKLHETFVEDFRRELAEIQSPEAKRLFVLAKANHLSHMRTAEYVTLVAAADVSGNHGVGVLLESCLADHLAFVERTKRLIRRVVEARLAARAAG